MTILQYKEEITSLNERVQNMVETAKAETRDLNEAEANEVNEIRQKISDYKEEIKKIEAEENREANKIINENTEEKNIKTQPKMKNTEKRFLEAVKNHEYRKDINLNTRSLPTVQVTGENGTHDAVIEEEFTDILEPLYSNSILSELGVQFRTGLPMGDIHVPTMEKGTVGFIGEVDPSLGTTNKFDFITLTPKRIAAYIDISEQQLRQDTIGVFNAVQRNLLKKCDEYIQEVFFGSAAGTAVKPAGIFYDKTVKSITDYAGLVDAEAEVEENNVFGAMRYALNPRTKAAFRSMIKGTNNTGMVYEAGEMDGVPASVTSSVPSKKFVYGNWNNILFATWGDTYLKIDDSINYVNGLVRVYLTAFVDWAVLRPEAFVFGTVASE